MKALDVLHHISPIANISFLLNLDFCNLILKSFKVYLALILNIESASSSFPRRRTVPRAIMGGGGYIFIYSCSARRISFESDCFYGM